jgi:plastocyanin
MTTTEDNQYHFNPHVIRVAKGGTVTFKLESGTHSTTAYASDNDKPQRIPDGTTAWDSGTMSEQGATFKHTFETEGVYDYYCTPHESLGMVGSIVVGDPSLDNQPGMAEPQSSLSDAAQSKIQSLNERVTSSLE